MPWISVERQPDRSVLVSGDLAHATGHRIRLADGDTDGIYAGWRWDGRELTLDHDRYGFYPLFSWTTGERRTIATDLSTLLDAGAPRDLDYGALSVFLRVGFFVGNDTPFMAIRAVGPPAPLPHRPVSHMSREVAIEAFIECFRAAIARRRPPSSFDMPLSGGRDSRHILLALIEAGHSPAACVTVEHFPPRGNGDIAVAADVCRRLGVRHVVLGQRADRLAAEREKNETTHYCTDEHAHFIALASRLRQSTPMTYDGIAGDVLSQSSYLTSGAQATFERGDPEACARFVLDGYGSMVSERALSHLLAPALLRQVPRGRAVARLAREIAGHLDAPNPVASFFFWNRTRREIALSPFALMRDIIVHAPYLDREVYDLLAGLPASLLMDRRFHTDAIARGYPRMADVPYETTDAEPHHPWLVRRVASGLARIALTSRGMLNLPGLAPGILATLADGNGGRLWHTSLMAYLAQLGALAALER